MRRRHLHLAGFALIGSVLSCAGGARSSTDPAAPPLTPTPGTLTRLDSDVVEETETYFIRRIPKESVIRLDDRRIKHPIIGPSIEFFKEDEKYYYVQVPKALSSEEAALRDAAQPALAESTPSATVPTPGPASASAPTAADFTDLIPRRVSGRVRLQPVSDSGLPAGGMWRAAFVIADVNGDKAPDIVSPPARVGGTAPRVWAGDGNGKFAEWPLRFFQDGVEQPNTSTGYGGIAAGDIDGDGHLDMAAAAHGGGLFSFFGDGTGKFAMVRKGLPGRDYSSQAVVLLDANGDGKLDIVASRDVVPSEEGIDRQQVRLYLFRDRKRGWEFQPEGIVGGFYSNSLHAWDFNGDRKQDVLTGSHYAGALTLIWQNQGNGKFTAESFPAVEIYAYHFATAPGTFGSDRVPAFVDAYNMFANDPETLRATGLSIYSYRGGQWSRHRVWRKKDGNSLLYAAALGDLDGDGLDDVVFPDSEERRLRIFFQEKDGSFSELARESEPALDSPGQCVRLVDLDGDGRLDVVLAKTVSSAAPNDPGGWSVYLNRR